MSTQVKNAAQLRAELQQIQSKPSPQKRLLNGAAGKFAASVAPQISADIEKAISSLEVPYGTVKVRTSNFELTHKLAREVTLPNAVKELYGSVAQLQSLDVEHVRAALNHALAQELGKLGFELVNLQWIRGESNATGTPDQGAKIVVRDPAWAKEMTHQRSGLKRFLPAKLDSSVSLDW